MYLDPRWFSPVISVAASWVKETLNKQTKDPYIRRSDIEQRFDELLRQSAQHNSTIREQHQFIEYQAEVIQQLQINNQQLTQILTQMLIQVLSANPGLGELPGNRIGIDPQLPQARQREIANSISSNISTSTTTRLLDEALQRSKNDRSSLSRVSSVQSQFKWALILTGIKSESIDRITTGLGKKEISTIKIFARNATGSRVSEISLGVDWDMHSKIAAHSPALDTNSLTWHEGVCPEVRDAARKLRDLSAKADLRLGVSITFAANVRQQTARMSTARTRLGSAARVPKPSPWAGKVVADVYRVIELVELTIVSRRVIEATPI